MIILQEPGICYNTVIKTRQESATQLAMYRIIYSVTSLHITCISLWGKRVHIMIIACFIRTEFISIAIAHFNGDVGI